MELQSDVDEFGRDVDADVLIRVLVDIGRVDEQGRRIFGQERGERDGVSWRSGERGGGEYVGCGGGECIDVEAVEQGFGCRVVQHASGAYVATAGTVDM